MNEFNPYETPQAMVEDIPPADVQVLAGRGARLGAWFMDFVIWLAAFAPIIVKSVQDVKARLAHGGPGGAGFVMVSIFALLAVLVWNLILLSSHGQTIGKRILSIRIVRTNGDRASLGRLFWMRGAIPAVIGAIPILGRVFTLVDALFIFGRDRRCIHDFIADTIVIQA